MVIRRIFIIPLMAFATVSIGQTLPEPILVDKYSVTPCDDFLGRLDTFLSELRNHPHSRGLIVIRNLPEGRHGSVILQSMIEYQLDFRGFDRSRIEIVRADGNGPNKEFWRLPPDAPTPAISRIVSGLEISENTKAPFVLAEETKFGMQICPAIDDQRIFADFLKANPNARGNIVVRDNSRLSARRKAARILKKFEVTYRISRARLRTFTGKFERPSNHDEPVVEYWYLP